MKFEEAIAEMRKGKRCRCSRYGDKYTYSIENGRLLVDAGVYKDPPVDSADFLIHECGSWSVVEPPPPLPRRFTAHHMGKPIIGAHFPSYHDKYKYWYTYNGHSHFSDGTDLMDLRFIDANS